MDDVNDFFDFSKKYERPTISGGFVNGRMVVDPNILSNEIAPREHIGTEYAKEFIKAELSRFKKTNDQSINSDAGKITLDDIDDLGATGEGNIEIYQRYDFKTKHSNQLPIMFSKENILKKLEENPVVVLQGATGCGKTTQVPQFILDDAAENGKYCNIIITQPRRIAAISIAKRISAERRWELGSIVGYQVGLKAEASEDTRILYCTTGVLLQKLIHKQSMSNFTHIILDEVHERDQDMDFLLIVVRRLLATNSRNVKIILMSATIDTVRFADYFKIPRADRNNKLYPSPVINIEKKNPFRVTLFYLDDMENLSTNQDIDINEPGISKEMYTTAKHIIHILATNSSRNIENGGSETGSFLVFLPGIYEIDEMHKLLQDLNNVAESPITYLIHPLHSQITSEEQQRVFRTPAKNVCKVILSTNIAESSITVPDIRYVIDFCLTKSLVTDTNTNVTSLQLDWASKNNCRQRAGRAGRLMSGKVYRMVPKAFFDNSMITESKPEMLRCPLEGVVLRAKLLNMGNPHAVLALAMDPPNLSDIQNTILTLKESGAMLKTLDQKYEKFDGDLTFLGRFMAALPVDIRVSRFILLGYAFSIMDECIIIAAGLTVKSIFSFPFNEQFEAYSRKLRWADGSGSDLFAILYAYKAWLKKIHSGEFKEEHSSNLYSDRFYVQLRSLNEMAHLINELKERIKKLGLIEPTGAHKIIWTEQEKPIVLKTVIAGAFYPNFFVRSAEGSRANERDAYQVLGGRDPCNTVFLTGLDPKYVGIIYQQSIIDMFKDCAGLRHNIKISFDNSGQKIFITFAKNAAVKPMELKIEDMPGRVQIEIYKAVKMRKIKISRELKVLSANLAIKYAEDNHLGQIEQGKFIPLKMSEQFLKLIVLPTASVKEVIGTIPYIKSVNQFWFQPLMDKTLESIQEQLNNIDNDLTPFSDARTITPGLMVAAKYDDSFYRGVIRAYNIMEHVFEVEFIDYGNCEPVSFMNIKELGYQTKKLNDVPPRCFECTLSNIQPNQLKSFRGEWLGESIQLFKHYVRNTKVTADVYSVVNGVVSVNIKLDKLSINQILIEEGFAQDCEENYMSKMDHDMRVRKQCSGTVGHDDLFEDYNTTIPFVEAPANCRNVVLLKGPFSPLETKVYSAMRLGGLKTVTVENHSSNSILLDNDPQDPHEKLLVATTITESSINGQLTVRETTVMPSIHGFAPLMALLFCPTMEINRDSSKSRYASILTGLGFDPITNNSLYEEHDMIFCLDTEITQSDLEIINQMRYSINTLFFTKGDESVPSNSEDTIKQLTAKLKELLIKLLEKNRRSVEIVHSANDHKWNKMDPEDVIDSTDMYGTSAIFPHHCALRLENENLKIKQALRKHCLELRSLSNLDMKIQPLRCKLCDTVLESIPEIRMHLHTKLHLDREEQVHNIN